MKLSLLVGLGCGARESALPKDQATEGCRVDGLSRAAECSTVEVLEDRTDPDSRKIPLRVVVVRARARVPASDPVFFLAGGPGQAATEAFPPLLVAYEDLTHDRDVVLVDIRGTGASTALDCDFGQTVQDQLNSEFDAAELERCHASLPGDSVHHTTRNVVADLEQVREGLAYDKVNLVGGSYGTRLALEYTRHHGDRVRTMVLDGVAPPQMAMPEGFAVDAQSAFDAAVGACAGEPACRAAFPDVAGDLDLVLSRLSNGPMAVELDHPRTGETIQITVDRAMFVGGLRGILYSPELTALLPLVLHRAAAGDLGPLLGQAVLFADSVGETMSVGLLLSMLCAEDLPRTDAKVQRVRDAETFLGTSVYDAMVRACEHWPHASEPENGGQPVVSDVPTMLLSGAVDPVTPPRWADIAAQTLSRSKHVVLPHLGHGTITRGCVPKMVTSFVKTADPIPADGESAADGECVAEIRRPPFFVDFAGPPH